MYTRERSQSRTCTRLTSAKVDLLIRVESALFLLEGIVYFIPVNNEKSSGNAMLTSRKDSLVLSYPLHYVCLGHDIAYCHRRIQQS